MFIDFRDKYESISETANFVNCSRTAVIKVHLAWQNFTIEKKRRDKCGRSWSIDDRGEHLLLTCVRDSRRGIVDL